MSVDRWSGAMPGKALCFSLVRVGSVLRELGREATQSDCVCGGQGWGQAGNGAEAVKIAG